MGIDLENMVCSNAAKEFAEINKQYSYDIYQYLYSTYGRIYLSLVLNLNKERIDVGLMKIEDYYDESIWEIEKEDYVNLETIINAMEYYVDYYLESMNDLHDKGFDWAVIAAMTRHALDADEIRRLMEARGY